MLRPLARHAEPIRLEGLVGTPAAVPLGMNVADHFEALTGSLSKLIGLHVKLARLEAVEDVKSFGSRAGLLLAVIPVAWAAFILLTGALLVALTRVLALDVALAVVGGVYALAAVTGALVVKRALSALQPPLTDSVAEVANSLSVVSEPQRTLRHG